MESIARVETDVEDSNAFKSNLGKFAAPRAQSSQAPLLESADDWKVQFAVNDEGGSTQTQKKSWHRAVRRLFVRGT